MKYITFPVVFILFSTLLITESFEIKRDLTNNNYGSGNNLLTILNDEDANVVARRKRARRSKRSFPTYSSYGGYTERPFYFESSLINLIYQLGDLLAALQRRIDINIPTSTLAG